MGLFKILKSVMGLGSSGSRSTSGTAEPGRENVDVTEYEPEPDTTSEDAVKGTGDETTADAASSPAAEPSGESDTDTDAATEPEVEPDESEPEVETGDDAEPEVDAEESVDESEPEVEADETETADTDEPDTETEVSGDEESEIEVENADASTDTVKGIGPSYAEALSEIGIETVGDLAAADAADIAGQTDLSEKRVGRWIARARGEDE